ncbi:MAG: glycosyltransferase [Acidimicrobiia bacterium]
MSGDEALTLVVPIFDEEDRVQEHGRALLDFVAALAPGSRLLFVDDGSTDSTAEIVAKLIEGEPHAELLLMPHAGKGAAVAAGLAAATTEYAGFCDVDLATPLPDLARIFTVATRAAVLAIGSRDVSASVVVNPESRWREALGRAYNRLLQATVTPSVVDTQCGAKVAATGIWRRLLPWCQERGFAWDAEVVAVALAVGVEVQEVPVNWHHDERTRVRVLRDGAGMVVATGRIVRRAREARIANAALGDAVDARTDWRSRSKAAFVATALRRTAGAGQSGLLVDAVVGGAGVTPKIGWDPTGAIVVEGDAQRAARARRVHGLMSAQGESDSLPLASDSVAVVCLLDVRTATDGAEAFVEAWRVLEPGGRLVVYASAPGYDREMLRSAVRRAGFRPAIVTRVFSWRVRVFERRGGIPVVVDTGAAVLTFVERSLIGRVSNPFGSAVLGVAVKPAQA